MPTMRPIFKHDCDVCVFLGHRNGYDTYACPQMGAPTIVCRYGDEGANYKSGLVSSTLDSDIRWGLSEALARGIIRVTWVGKKRGLEWL